LYMLFYRICFIINLHLTSGRMSLCQCFALA
jgi:hypothetical protein